MSKSGATHVFGVWFKDRERAVARVVGGDMELRDGFWRALNYGDESYGNTYAVSADEVSTIRVLSAAEDAAMFGEIKA